MTRRRDDRDRTDRDRSDRDLGMHREISRRDFMNGVLIGGSALGAAIAGRPTWSAESPAAYPPKLTGLRGSHVGSFEVAHALRDGAKFPTDAPIVEPEYDLVVVGAGLSGLATAFFYRERHGDARVLVLDTNDDFGGHAKRNEFDVAGRTLIGYGGSQSIDGPAHYSPVSQSLLQTLGVDVERFYQAFDQTLYQRFGMSAGIHFSASAFGKHHIARADALDMAATLDTKKIAGLPLSPAGRADLERLVSDTDFLPGLAQAERIERLRAQSYLDYATKTVGVGREVETLLKRLPNTLWGLDFDALSALEGLRLNAPGFAGTTTDGVDDLYPDDEPYIFHFPDGNAGLARLLVRRLIPGVAPGKSMDDIVAAAFDYGQLDVDGNAVRIRLSSTVVRVLPDAERADVVYARAGAIERVRARRCVLAGYHRMAPLLVPELPQTQKAALTECVRTPLVYTNVVLRNWRPFARAGVHSLYCPTGFYAGMMLDFPVSLGAYTCTRTPDAPIVVHLDVGPVPGDGQPALEQCKAGRQFLYTQAFDDLERELRKQLADALSPTGLDPARDVLAITINRWPHGFAREYNDLCDRFPKDAAPWVAARKRFGPIAIAGSESEGHAYADGAFDAAFRAVEEIST